MKLYNQELKDTLQDLEHLHNNGFESVRFEIVKPLIEKGTPMKVIKIPALNGYLDYCKCDYELNDSLKFNYCANCGQRLDWSELK